jgi:ubiquinone/menaquinone biosynthesis C-methylase UbiE
MALRDLSVTGLDLSPAMHPIAAQRLMGSKAAPSLVRARAQILPFQQGSFDTIVATFPAPYILDSATLRECVRVLRAPAGQGREPAGRLVIVGLWAELENPVLRTLLPLFYGRPDAGWLRSLSAQFEALGMDVTLTDRSDGFARIGVVVAQCRREFDRE